jgi:hypothetical protein
MSSTVKKRLIVLLVVIVALVAVILIFNMTGKAPDDANTGVNAGGSQGRVIEDEVTVEVDIPEDEGGDAASSDAAVED